MKKILLLILVICAVFTACNEKMPSIKVIGENSANLSAMEALKSDYETKENIKIVFRPNTFEDAFTKANQDFANHTALYDIILQYNFSLSSFVRNDYINILSSQRKDIPTEKLNFEKDLFPNVWKEIGYYYEDIKNKKGIKQIAYPFAANTLVLVYNKDLFNKHSKEYQTQYGVELKVPTTLEEYVQVANFFNKGETKGVCLQGAGGGWLYYEWNCLLLGAGGKLMDKTYGWQGDENTQINLTSKEAIVATQALMKMKSTNGGDFTTTDANEQLILMQKGNIAMGFMWSDYVYNFINKGDGNFDNRFEFAPIPGNVSPIAGGSFYINKDSKNPQKSLEYVISLLQEKNQIELMKYGYCSPLSTTYDAPSLSNIPYLKALKESLIRGVYAFEAGADSDMVSQILTVYLQKIWNKEISIEEGLKKAQEEINVERKKIFSTI